MNEKRFFFFFFLRFCVFDKRMSIASTTAASPIVSATNSKSTNPINPSKIDSLSDPIRCSPVRTDVECRRCGEAPRDNVRIVMLSECGHPLCSECMRRDTMDTIASGRRTSRLACPCGSLVNIADLAAAFDDREMKAFRRLFVE
jgi:hypothetical protein